MQLSLFENNIDIKSYNESKIKLIEGLSIFYDFISEEDEVSIIETIDNNKWLLDLSRRVQHYGYKYDYKKRRIDNKMYLGKLPEWLQKITLVMIENNVIDFTPDQAIINEYQPGQGIAPHIDCEPCFGDTIISLSLGSSCMMNFEKEPNSKQKIEIFLEPRSLIIMREESRYNLYHSIPSRKKDKIADNLFTRNRRISVTFRKIIY